MGDLPITSMLTTAHFNGIRASACKSGFGYDKVNDGFYFEVSKLELIIFIEIQVYSTQLKKLSV